jgi:hypothetical protein
MLKWNEVQSQLAPLRFHAVAELDQLAEAIPAARKTIEEATRKFPFPATHYYHEQKAEEVHQRIRGLIRKAQKLCDHRRAELARWVQDLDGLNSETFHARSVDWIVERMRSTVGAVEPKPGMGLTDSEWLKQFPEELARLTKELDALGGRLVEKTMYVRDRAAPPLKFNNDSSEPLPRWDARSGLLKK